jgi:hypothetical protein
MLFTLFALCTAVTAPIPPPVQAEVQGVAGQTVGTPSCSARACHGGDEPLPNRRIGRNEYTAWNYADPHTRTLQVLYNELSANIVRRLGWQDAHKEPRCLACHAETASEFGSSRLTSAGCESCHGPAWSWLGPHTLGPGWREKYPAASKALLDVSDLAATARSCVGCHIGAPPGEGLGVRDMNHDMIAAGHPRLNFEFAGYLAQLPPHWNPKSLPDMSDPRFRARAWAVGQVISAEAALKLLEHRAGQAGWPELAEYSCYACHHDLAGPGGWRQKEGSAGTLPWGSWYFAALSSVVPGVAEALDDLESALAQRPAGQIAALRAQAFRQALAREAAEVFEPTYPADGQLRARLARRFRSLAARDWDGAAQLYLAVVALNPNLTAAQRSEFWRRLRQPRQFSANREQYLKELEQFISFAGGDPP